MSGRIVARLPELFYQGYNTVGKPQKSYNIKCKRKKFFHTRLHVITVPDF